MAEIKGLIHPKMKLILIALDHKRRYFVEYSSHSFQYNKSE